MTQEREERQGKEQGRGRTEKKRRENQETPPVRLAALTHCIQENLRLGSSQRSWRSLTKIAFHIDTWVRALLRRQGPRSWGEAPWSLFSTAQGSCSSGSAWANGSRALARFLPQQVRHWSVLSIQIVVISIIIFVLTLLLLLRLIPASASTTFFSTACYTTWKWRQGAKYEPCGQPEAIEYLISCTQYDAARPVLVDMLWFRPPDDYLMEICLRRSPDRKLKGRNQTLYEGASASFLIEIDRLRLHLWLFPFSSASMTSSLTSPDFLDLLSWFTMHATLVWALLMSLALECIHYSLHLPTKRDNRNQHDGRISDCQTNVHQPRACSLDFVQSVALFSSAFLTSPPPSLLQNSISRCISEALRPERSSSLCVYYSFLLREESKRKGWAERREKKKRKREKRKAPWHLQLHHRSMELVTRRKQRMAKERKERRQKRKSRESALIAELCSLRKGKTRQPRSQLVR